MHLSLLVLQVRQNLPSSNPPSLYTGYSSFPRKAVVTPHVFQEDLPSIYFLRYSMKHFNTIYNLPFQSGPFIQYSIPILHIIRCSITNLIFHIPTSFLPPSSSYQRSPSRTLYSFSPQARLLQHVFLLVVSFLPLSFFIFSLYSLFSSFHLSAFLSLSFSILFILSTFVS